MHVLIVQQPGGGNPASLWEMWVGVYSGGSSPSWTDGSNALWPNIGSTGAGAYQMVPQGVGTSDAAGLPIAPLLLTADEVIGTGTPTSPNGVVQHPVRFTLDSTLGYYVWPATHQAGGGYCFGGYEDQNAHDLSTGPTHLLHLRFPVADPNGRDLSPEGQRAHPCLRRNQPAGSCHHSGAPRLRHDSGRQRPVGSVDWNSRLSLERCRSELPDQPDLRPVRAGASAAVGR